MLKLKLRVTKIVNGDEYKVNYRNYCWKINIQ